MDSDPVQDALLDRLAQNFSILFSELGGPLEPTAHTCDDTFRDSFLYVYPFVLARMALHALYVHFPGSRHRLTSTYRNRVFVFVFHLLTGTRFSARDMETRRMQVFAQNDDYLFPLHAEEAHPGEGYSTGSLQTPARGDGGQPKSRKSSERSSTDVPLPEIPLPLIDEPPASRFSCPSAPPVRSSHGPPRSGSPPAVHPAQRLMRTPPNGPFASPKKTPETGRRLYEAPRPWPPPIPDPRTTGTPEEPFVEDRPPRGQAHRYESTPSSSVRRQPFQAFRVSPLVRRFTSVSHNIVNRNWLLRRSLPNESLHANPIPPWVQLNGQALLKGYETLKGQTAAALASYKAEAEMRQRDLDNEVVSLVQHSNPQQLYGRVSQIMEDHAQRKTRSHSDARADIRHLLDLTHHSRKKPQVAQENLPQVRREEKRRLEEAVKELRHIHTTLVHDLGLSQEKGTVDGGRPLSPILRGLSTPIDPSRHMLRT
eukprot:GAFH01001158.1.p1 GENE.GAFH01001158.1~~GAFH01001158.1.p1  ORF type:complete len:482 (-),score=-13.52 GAFH01001158.1:364-1809(-)